MNKPFLVSLKKALAIVLCTIGGIMSIIFVAMIVSGIGKDNTTIISGIIALVLFGFLPIWGGLRMLNKKKKHITTNKVVRNNSIDDSAESPRIEESSPQIKAKKDQKKTIQDHSVIVKSSNKIKEIFSKHKEKIQMVLGSLLVLSVVIGIIRSCNELVNENKSPQVENSATTNTLDKTPTPPASIIPQMQSDFVRIFGKYSSEYGKAENELQMSVLRTKRSKEFSQFFSTGKKAENWVGTLVSLSTNGEGKAALEIELLDTDIKIKTWNNAFSDFDDNTLIPQESELFNSLINMKEGDTVIFSGRFFTSSEDGIKFCNMTELGAMTSPEILMKFGSVSKK